jgi:hypothetical protein
MIYTAWILCLHPPDVFGEPLIHTVASLFFFVATTVELRWAAARLLKPIRTFQDVLKPMADRLNLHGSHCFTMCHCIKNWFMVGGWATPLKNTKVNWDYSSQYKEKETMFQTTTNQMLYFPAFYHFPHFHREGPRSTASWNFTMCSRKTSACGRCGFCALMCTWRPGLSTWCGDGYGDLGNKSEGTTLGYNLVYGYELSHWGI